MLIFATLNIKMAFREKNRELVIQVVVVFFLRKFKSILGGKNNLVE